MILLSPRAYGAGIQSGELHLSEKGDSEKRVGSKDPSNSRDWGSRSKKGGGNDFIKRKNSLKHYI